MKRVIRWVTLRWEWLKNPDNRFNVYRFMQAFSVVLIAAGFITPDEAGVWTQALGGLLLLSSSTVAKRNVDK